MRVGWCEIVGRAPPGLSWLPVLHHLKDDICIDCERRMPHALHEEKCRSWLRTCPEGEAMSNMPETRYAKSGDTYIAYQVMGEGPFDLVFVPGFISHLEVQMELPAFASFVGRLASFCRLIRFDKRGTGLSDRLSAIPTLEERMDDVRAVMDAAGSTRAALFGFSEGGPMCIVFAATYPERTTALILYGSYARGAWAPDYPWRATDEQFEAFS